MPGGVRVSCIAPSFDLQAVGRVGFATKEGFGRNLTFTVSEVEQRVAPMGVFTVTMYLPGVVTDMEEVVAPVLHTYVVPVPAPFEASKMMVSPVQIKVSGPKLRDFACAKTTLIVSNPKHPLASTKTA